VPEKVPRNRNFTCVRKGSAWQEFHLRQKWQRMAGNSLAPEMTARGRKFINRLGRISKQ